MTCTSKIVCVVALQLLVNLMTNFWAFSIAAHTSTESHYNSYLDFMVQLRASRNGTPLLSFQLLAILLFNKSHSDQSLYGIIARLRCALCTDLERQLLGSFTDEETNITGEIQGFSTRLKIGMAQ